MGPSAAADLSAVAGEVRDGHRNLPDRRRRSTPTLSLYSLTGKGRRNGNRRHSDRFRHACVDGFGLHSLLVIATGLLLCIADAFFTLQLVNRGAHELNPVMGFFLRLGPGVFLAVKYAATGISLIVLLLFKNRPFWKERIYGRHVLAAVPFIYALLILWELSLNLRLP